MGGDGEGSDKGGGEYQDFSKHLVRDIGEFCAVVLGNDELPALTPSQSEQLSSGLGQRERRKERRSDCRGKGWDEQHGRSLGAGYLGRRGCGRFRRV